MEQRGSRRALGIVFIGSGALVLLCGVAGDSIPFVVAGCLAAVLGVTFVAAGRQPSGETEPAQLHLPGQESSLAPPIFSASLRGYDMVRVDELIRGCDAALGSGDVPRIEQAKADLDRERVALPIALRGYVRDQVDEFLERLSTVLGHRIADSDTSDAS